MAKTYRYTPVRRLVNGLLAASLRLGLGPKSHYLLTVRGRRSNQPSTRPVRLVEEGGERWLVAPYGVVNWVRNARATGQVTLTRGSRSETVGIQELEPEESAPILKKYLREVPITRSYFDARPDAPVEAFVPEATRHPVFRLTGPAGR